MSTVMDYLILRSLKTELEKKIDTSHIYMLHLKL